MTTKPLSVADPRLTLLFQTAPERCCTISEYAQASGIEVGRVLELLEPLLNTGVLSLEIVGTDIFVHTSPSGRPSRSGVDVLPNTWEYLRASSDQPTAYTLYKTVRALQLAGWAVETNPVKVNYNLNKLSEPPQLAIRVNGYPVPLILDYDHHTLSQPGGRLDVLASAGASAIAVTVPSGVLDAATTTARVWHSQPGQKSVVLILEAPRYNPVIIKSSDSAVEAVSVSRLASDI